MTTRILISTFLSTLFSAAVFAAPPSKSTSPNTRTKAPAIAVETERGPTMTRTAATGAKRPKIVTCNADKRARDARCRMHCDGRDVS